MEHVGIALVLLFFLVLAFIVRYKWRRAQARADEVKRLAYLAAAEAERAEFESVREYEASIWRQPSWNDRAQFEPVVRQPVWNERAEFEPVVREYEKRGAIGVDKSGVCVVCGTETSARCSRCKAVKYCSGKCQIFHWRNGHKDACHQLKRDEELNNQSNIPISNSNLKSAQIHEIKTPSPNEEITKLPPPSELEQTAISEKAKVRVVKKEINDDNKSGLELSNGNATAVPTKEENSVLETSRRVTTRLNKLTEEKKPDTIIIINNKVNNNEEKSNKIVSENKPVKPVMLDIKGASKRAVASQKMLFPYELFIRLYNSDKVDFKPFGLANIGNSCYANAVFQCLTFTRPLAAYLLEGHHSKKCPKMEWCFTCEFERLILKGKQGNSDLSPKKILYKLIDNGSTFGLGREEDAHEFMKYVIDKMQSVCIKETGSSVTDRLREETSIVQLIFGGNLRSKITCQKCQGSSVQIERMLDLTVEIQGNISTLEEALTQFTSTEILDGDNKYQCDGCRSYERAKKKMTILEAPNVLTIALKRYQAGKYGKITKPVRYPELLNLAKYMSGTEDTSPVYTLYAVVVHKDTGMNASFSGHYISYVKDAHNTWFKINDSKVKQVSVEKVLSKCAYLLLYARCSPRAPSLVRRSMRMEPVRHKPSPVDLLRRNRPTNLTNRGGSAFPDESSSDTSSLLSNSDEGSSTSSTSTETTESTVEYDHGDEYDRYNYSIQHASYKSRFDDPKPD